MPKQRRLETGVDWVELSTTAADWKAADPALLGDDARRSCTSSARSRRRCSNSPARASSTAPRTPASARRAARSAPSSGCARRDGVNGSHRGHHQFLAKALTHVTGGTHRPGAPGQPATIQTVLQRTLAEILGLAQGYCRGRGGSMHLQWFEAGALGTNAIVGGGAPMAAGNAWAQKHGASDGTDRPHDQLLRRRRQPDRLGARVDEPRRRPGSCRSASSSRTTSTPSRPASTRSSPTPRFSVRGQGFGIPGWRVDGMDPLAVHLAMQAGGRAHARRARAPPSSRPRSTASSTRTARTRAAPSATAPRRRRRSGASATRSSASPREMIKLGLIDDGRRRRACASRRRRR